MENLDFLSFQMLDEIMCSPDNIKEKYKEALSLITDRGMRLERAFKESGFTEAYEMFKNAPATTPASEEAGA